MNDVEQQLQQAFSARVGELQVSPAAESRLRAAVGRRRQRRRFVLVVAPMIAVAAAVGVLLAVQPDRGPDRGTAPAVLLPAPAVDTPTPDASTPADTPASPPVGATPPNSPRPVPPASTPPPIPAAAGGPAELVGLTGGTDQQQAFVYDARTGRRLRQLRVPEGQSVDAVAAVPGGGFLVAHAAAVTGPTGPRPCATTVESIGTSTAFRLRLEEGVGNLAVSPDGATVAIAGGCPAGSLELRSTADGRLLRRWTEAPFAHDNGLFGLSFSPGGRWLAFVYNPCCGGGTDGVHVLDTTAPGTSYLGVQLIDEYVGSPVPTDSQTGEPGWLDATHVVVARSGPRSSDLVSLDATAPRTPPRALSPLPSTAGHVINVRSGATSGHLLVEGSDACCRRVYRYDGEVLRPLALTAAGELRW